jgi:hypothetical protein
MNSEIPPPTRRGSLFILLAPTALSVETENHQQALQALFGGTITAPVHFTCQRFMFPEEAGLQRFMAGLKARLAESLPIPVSAYAVVPLYSQFRRGRVLKWRITISPALEAFASAVAGELSASGGLSLYPPGWRSTLITALDCIDSLDVEGKDAGLLYPQPLFVGDQVLLSRFIGLGRYETLEAFPLSAAGRSQSGNANSNEKHLPGGANP